MPEPISIMVGAYCLGHATLGSFSGQGSAISSAAIELDKEASAMEESIDRTYFLSGEKSSTISCLYELASECAEENWDGNGAYAVDDAALFWAERFLRAMPEYLPMPEIAPDPDGDISLDWAESPHRRFSLSTGRSNRLAYAWLDGVDSGYAADRFDGISVPSRIISIIESIIGHGRI